MLNCVADYTRIVRCAPLKLSNAFKQDVIILLELSCWGYRCVMVGVGMKEKYLFVRK